MSTCETMNDTDTAARSAPSCAGARSKAPNGCAPGFEAWPRPEERPQQSRSTATPQNSGRRAVEAIQETGASRSALIRNLPERVLSAPAFFGLILAGVLGGACVGALIVWWSL